MIPPRYTLVPIAVLRMNIPIKLKWTYIVLYALAWSNDYRYITESLEEMAEIFSEFEEKRVTARMMRSRMNGLVAHGLIERRRSGLRYITHLLVRHDKPASKVSAVSAEEQIAADLPRSKPGRVSCLDEFVYEVLDELGCDYIEQYHPSGCPYWFDVFLRDLNLLIELDSEYWHRGERAKKEGAVQSDRRKDAWARGHGYDLIRLKVSDIRDGSERDRLKQKIEQIVQRGDPQLSPLRSPPRRANYINADDADIDPGSDQDQQQHHHYSNTGDVELFDENLELLEMLGIDEPVAKRLAREEHVTPAYLQAWLEHQVREATEGNVLGPGFFVIRIGQGEEPPVDWRQGLEERKDAWERERYIRGKYADYIKH